VVRWYVSTLFLCLMVRWAVLTRWWTVIKEIEKEEELSSRRKKRAAKKKAEEQERNQVGGPEVVKAQSRPREPLFV
jgi:hypothetical protein